MQVGDSAYILVKLKQYDAAMDGWLITGPSAGQFWVSSKDLNPVDIHHPQPSTSTPTPKADPFEEAIKMCAHK